MQIQIFERDEFKNRVEENWISRSLICLLQWWIYRYSTTNRWFNMSFSSIAIDCFLGKNTKNMTEHIEQLSFWEKEFFSGEKKRHFLIISSISSYLLMKLIIIKFFRLRKMVLQIPWNFSTKKLHVAVNSPKLLQALHSYSKKRFLKPPVNQKA